MKQWKITAPLTNPHVTNGETEAQKGSGSAAMFAAPLGPNFKAKKKKKKKSKHFSFSSPACWMRDRAQGFRCDVKGPSGIPQAGEGWKTLTPKHQSWPEKPSPGLGKPKGSVCHLDRNKLEIQTLKKKDQKEKKKKPQSRSSKKRAVAKQQVTAGRSLPAPWAPSRAPSPKPLPSREASPSQRRLASHPGVK